MSYTLYSLCMTVLTVPVTVTVRRCGRVSSSSSWTARARSSCAFAWNVRKHAFIQDFCRNTPATAPHLANALLSAGRRCTMSYHNAHIHSEQAREGRHGRRVACGPRIKHVRDNSVYCTMKRVDNATDRRAGRSRKRSVRAGRHCDKRRLEAHAVARIPATVRQRCNTTAKKVQASANK